MSITYNTDTVGTYAEIESYMEEPADPEYVSGSGAWAHAGEMSTDRFKSKSKAYLSFVSSIMGYHQLKEFLTQADPEEKKELVEGLCKEKISVIKLIFKGE